MAETNPELQSSIGCYRQVVPSDGLEKFLISASTIGRQVFGQREKFYVELPDTPFDLGLEEKVENIGPRDPYIEVEGVLMSMESASVDVITTFRSRSLRSTLFYLHGSASYEIDNSFLRLYGRIRAETIKGSSYRSTKQTRPNTFKQDVRAVQDIYYQPEIDTIEVIIQGIKAVRPESLPGTLYNLSVDPDSVGAEILGGQQKVIQTTLAKMAAYRNAVKLASREQQPSPLIIPFAYVPSTVKGESEIFIDSISKIAQKNVPTLTLALPKWKPKPESG